MLSNSNQLVFSREQDYIAIFHTIHRVLSANKPLKKQAVDFLLILAPPRELTSTCGLALRFASEQTVGIECVLAKAFLLRAGLHCAPGAHYSIDTFPQRTVGISPYWFNNEQHIERLLKAWAELVTDHRS